MYIRFDIFILFHFYFHTFFPFFFNLCCSSATNPIKSIKKESKRKSNIMKIRILTSNKPMEAAILNCHPVNFESLENISSLKQTVQMFFFSNSTFFNRRINKTANKVKMNIDNPVSRLMLIELGLSDVTEPKNGRPPWLSMIYYTNIFSILFRP